MDALQFVTYTPEWQRAHVSVGTLTPGQANSAIGEIRRLLLGLGWTSDTFFDSHGVEYEGLLASGSAFIFAVPTKTIPPSPRIAAVAGTVRSADANGPLGPAEARRILL